VVWNPSKIRHCHRCVACDACVQSLQCSVVSESSITQPRIHWSCSNLEHRLTTWRAIYHTCSRSRGQRSRSQRDVTGAKICQIMNNSGGDCSISIKLTTDYDHVTSDQPQTFKVNGSKVKVIAWYGVLASKNRHISWTYNCIEFKLCVNYPRA